MDFLGELVLAHHLKVSGALLYQLVMEAAAINKAAKYSEQK